jgi:excisionase family DNA binding protein
MESMMTARQVAELLGVHENWVYDQAASGELPSYKIGGARRFDPQEVRGWIVGHREAERGREKRMPAVRKANSATETHRASPRKRRAVDSKPQKDVANDAIGQDLRNSGGTQARLFET